jgi:hypothetical protein
MIGGIDIRLPSKAGLESIEVATRAVRQLWPRAVFEHGDTGEHYAFFWQVPFGELRELFVYRDGQAAEVWDAKGAISEVSNTMIHIIYDDDLVTMVIDERDAEMETMVEAIRSGLNDSILYIPAELAEAA